MSGAWLLVALLAAAPELTHDECSRGPKSVLRLGTWAPVLQRHDGPEARSEVELVEPTGKRLALHPLYGSARCLGWLAGKAAHLVSVEAEVGVIVPVYSLVLIADDGTLARTRLETDEVLALALVVDPTGSRVALVGSRKQGPWRLFLLDLLDDTLRELGEAPAPPPIAEAVKGRWTWNAEAVGRVVTLEPAVLRFEADGLHATYGADSSKRRATARREKSWKLAKR